MSNGEEESGIYKCRHSSCKILTFRSIKTGNKDIINFKFVYNIYIPLHTHDYLNSRTKFETLVWRLMKGLAQN